MNTRDTGFGRHNLDAGYLPEHLSQLIGPVREHSRYRSIRANHKLGDRILL